MQARQGNPRWNPAYATSRLPEGWAEFLSSHCACIAALQDGNRVEAYEKAVAALQPFLKVLSMNWAFPWGPAQFLAGLRCNLCLYLLAQRQIFPTSDLSRAKCQPCRCSAKTLVPGWWHRCTV